MLKAKLINQSQLKGLAKAKGFQNIEDFDDMSRYFHESKPAAHLPVSASDIPDVYEPRSLAENYKLDSEQQAFVDHVAARGGHACLTGFAGTGKTQATVPAVLAAMAINPPLWGHPTRYYSDLGIDPEHPYLPAGNPGVVLCAFTRNATSNVGSRLPTHHRYIYTDDAGNSVDLGSINAQSCAITIHKLLQFRPQPQEGGDSLLFAPYRNSTNKLPPEIGAVFIDEATLPNLQLFGQLLDAIHPHTRIYLIGDIFQIQSVGGISTLAAAMTFTKVFSLKHIYRYMGAILKLATDVRTQQTEYLQPKSYVKDGDLETGLVSRITYGVDRVADEAAYKYCGSVLAQLYLKGAFVPGLDLAVSFHDPDLSSVSNRFGITNIYRDFASRVDKELGRATYYIRTAGEDKHGNRAVVLAAGDTVYADVNTERSLWLVLRISKNPRSSAESFPASYINTRCPATWKEAYESQNPETKLNLEYTEVSGLDMTMFNEVDEAGSSAPEDEAKVGRQATHLLTMMDVGSLFSYIQPRTQDADSANLLTEQVIKQLTFMALRNDQLQMSGTYVTPEQFRAAVEETLEAYGLADYTAGGLQTLGNGAAVKDVKPFITTAHVVQGLSGRKVVFMTHQSTPGFTEMGYTACTRPRHQLITITQPSFWGTNMNDPATKKHRSDVHSPQISGVTVEQKVDSLMRAIKTGSLSFDAKARSYLMGRMGFKDDTL